jgi:hypothetical protein
MTRSRRDSGKRPSGRTYVDRLRGPKSASQCDTAATSLRAADASGRFVALDEADRFWSQVVPPPWWRPWGCWLWAGTRNAEGYGVFTTAAGRKVRAHRWLALDLELVQGHACHDRDRWCPGGPTCPHRACVRTWAGPWWWPPRWRRPHVVPMTPEQNRRLVNERRRNR